MYILDEINLKHLKWDQNFSHAEEYNADLFCLSKRW